MIARCSITAECLKIISVKEQIGGHVLSKAEDGVESDLSNKEEFWNIDLTLVEHVKD
ncbi:predicted protein [Arabidopsis lyrata subsp. lyrata]|uniref:Predicted protein n=1 Tax=Arabidopsis lyrata subsp. lyrata TaxID=81972 RepID=D7KNZ9_ARALL|nr:predicted protein [Arabidopsis lyrata subsp. lyrata]